MSFPDDLQIELLKHSDNALVLGGPGSGKTTTALLKAKSLIEELKPFQKILFLSFSNSAIGQIRTTLKNHQLSFSKEERNKIHIQTYHSFCFDIIKNYSFILGVNQQIKLIPPEFLKAELAKNEIQENTPEHSQFVLEIFMKEGLVEFDLFGSTTLQIFRNSTHVVKLLQSLYPFILLDEFQDTNIEQSEIVYQLASKSIIICLADREQMIYTYVTGVDEKRIDEAIKILQPKIIDFKGRNYRSKNPDIINFGNNILSNSPKPLPKSVGFKSYRFNNQISTGLKSTIISIRNTLQKNEGIKSPSIAILTRTNKSAVFVSNQLNSTSGQMSFPIFHNLKKDENDLIFCNRIICSLLGITFRDTRNSCNQTLLEFSNWYFMNGKKTAVEKGKKIENWATNLRFGKTPNVNLVTDLYRIIPEIKSNVTGQIQLDADLVIRLCSSYNNEYLQKFNNLSYSANHFKESTKFCWEINDSYKRYNSYQELLGKYESHMNTSRILDSEFSINDIDVMNMYKVKGREYDAIILFDGIYQNLLIRDKDINNPYDIKKVLRVAVTRARHSVSIYYNLQNHNTLKDFFNIS